MKSSTLKEKNILILEDDDTLRQLYKEFLEGLGFSTHLKSDGFTAAVDAQYKEFDLIILDINVPLMNGLEVIRSIRSKDVKTPILVVTGQVTEDVTSAVEGGKNMRLFSKPFQLEQLESAMYEMIKITDL